MHNRCVIVAFLCMFAQRTHWKLAQNRYTTVLEEARSAGKTFIDLTISNPTQCRFHYDSRKILAAFQNPRALAYEPEAKGLLSARQQVAQYYKEDHGASVDSESLLLTISTSEAYSYVFRLLCNPHDEILVPKPSYPLFDILGDIQDVSLIPYSLQYAHGWFIDFHSLVRALTPRTRAVLLVHPNNPTGSFVRGEELQKLNDLCRERNLALVVDEVFLDYALDGQKRGTFADNHGALTFTLSGLSKMAALPQMKVAWLVVTGPESLVQSALDRLEIIADTYLSLNSPTQWAFPTLFSQRHELQPQVLERVRENWVFLKAQFGSNSQCEVLDAEGGWYAVLKAKGDEPDDELAIKLLRDAGVLVHPGHFYDFPADGHLVLSLISPREEFRSGVARMLEYLQRPA
jgi:aspartate/methionine/tyrosine aminotransferase